MIQITHTPSWWMDCDVFIYIYALKHTNNFPLINFVFFFLAILITVSNYCFKFQCIFDNKRRKTRDVSLSFQTSTISAYRNRKHSNNQPLSTWHTILYCKSQKPHISLEVSDTSTQECAVNTLKTERPSWVQKMGQHGVFTLQKHWKIEIFKKKRETMQTIFYPQN